MDDIQVIVLEHQGVMFKDCLKFGPQNTETGCVGEEWEGWERPLHLGQHGLVLSKGQIN